MIPLIAFGIMVGTVWGLFDPFVALAALLADTIIRPGDIFPLFAVLHVERMLFVVVVVSMLTHGGKLQVPPLTRTMLLFYIACLASVPLAFWVSNALTNALNFGKTIVESVIASSLIQTRKQLRMYLLLFVGLVGYLAVSTYLQYRAGSFYFAMGVDRPIGLGGAANNPDTLGLTLVLTLPLIALFMTKGNTLSIKLGMIAVAAACLLTTFITGSRGSVLTLILIAGVAALRSRKRWILIPAAVLLGCAIWAALPAQYQTRYLSVEHLKKNGSYALRVISWRGGWHMFLHNPLTGVGIGNYTDANGSKYWPGPGRKVWLDAHSLYFKLLGELGALGVIAFASFVWTFFKVNREMGRRMRAAPERYPPWLRGYPRACNYCILGLLYCGYAYHDLYRDTWYTLAGVSAALFLILQREDGAEAIAPASGEAVPLLAVGAAS